MLCPAMLDGRRAPAVIDKLNIYSPRMYSFSVHSNASFRVAKTSRRNAVRSALSGAAARSTVRRHLTQRRFLDDVAKQTKILKLQGSLFFGTINSVESLVRKMLDLDEWHKNPISFLVMDFGLVQSVDFSAMEAMLRIRRMLRTRDVHLVFCGLSLDGDVAHSLQKADLWTDEA